MSHHLILEIPNDIYAPLAEIAKGKGMTPEQFALELLGDAAHDPMEKFIGSLRSDIPDWSDQHDKYLGEELLNTHDEANSGS
jgi:hypothetical protein